jgi:hypothetical protein
MKSTVPSLDSKKKNWLRRLNNRKINLWNGDSAPVAAHGSWERLIKSTKYALRGILSEMSVTEDVLLTAIVEAEALLNSWPLTHFSVIPDDLEALTPNHFLLLRAYPSCHLDFSLTPSHPAVNVINKPKKSSRTSGIFLKSPSVANSFATYATSLSTI